MEAIVLAGGKGTRLQSVVSDVPKPLAPVNGQPFLNIILEQLNGFKTIERVILSLGYKAELIEACYRNNHQYGFEIGFSVEQTPMGTGGALFLALPDTTSDDILLLNGDSYVDFNLEALRDVHGKSGAGITMVVVEVQDTARYGSVELDGANHRVLGFTEKSGGGGRGFVNAGCYLISRRIFGNVPQRPASFERDILPQHLRSTYGHITKGKFIDIGVPESYSAASEYLR